MQALHFLNRHQHTTSAPIGSNATHHSLHYALSTALAERRTDVLRHLAQRHDSALMAQALICLNSRQRADLLSLLNPEQRLSIHAELPRHAQKQWNLTQRCQQPARRRLFQRFMKQWRHPLSWLRPRLTHHADN
ncbi:hypothetical protein [Comamonas sp. lk]|uniref:hypothetical protein n=1 Tax=Comamonas sp. lk TaxID=2201272 RepID=UPI000EB35485|nr:hypothetical protein [Comamonas sp. lk]